MLSTFGSATGHHSRFPEFFADWKTIRSIGHHRILAAQRGCPDASRGEVIQNIVINGNDEVAVAANDRVLSEASKGTRLTVFCCVDTVADPVSPGMWSHIWTGLHCLDAGNE